MINKPGTQGHYFGLMCVQACVFAPLQLNLKYAGLTTDSLTQSAFAPTERDEGISYSAHLRINSIKSHNETTFFHQDLGKLPCTSNVFSMRKSKFSLTSGHDIVLSLQHARLQTYFVMKFLFQRQLHLAITTSYNSECQKVIN